MRKFLLKKILTMNLVLRVTYLFIVLALSIQTNFLFAQENQEHQVFLIGDAGEPDRAPKNLEVLRQQLEAADENSTLIFLGDNIYAHGLPDKNDPERQIHEE